MTTSSRLTAINKREPTELHPNGDVCRPEAVVARSVDEMRAAWRNGERPLAEDFFRLHPELQSDAEAAVRLVYEELCLREECGQRMASLEIAKRFPQWETRLRFLLSFRAHLQPSPSAAMPGEESAGMLPSRAVDSENGNAAFAPPAFALRSGGEAKVSLEGARGPQAPDESGQAESLAAQLAEEMKAAWRQGQRPMAEDFFNRHPELCRDPQGAVRLIYEEICLRQEYGLPIVPARHLEIPGLPGSPG